LPSIASNHKEEVILAAALETKKYVYEVERHKIRYNPECSIWLSRREQKTLYLKSTQLATKNPFHAQAEATDKLRGTAKKARKLCRLFFTNIYDICIFFVCGDTINCMLVYLLQQPASNHRYIKDIVANFRKY
uniref:Uncharacterized protein n=1 Tax=Glossina palpalis gambiensis TaxID=67801 RepID=A0A1B0BU26_9MUSC